MNQRLDGREPLVYRVVLALYLALTGGLLLKSGLMLIVAWVVPSLCTLSVGLGVFFACVLGLIPVFLWVGALRWILPSALSADDSSSNLLMHRSLGVVGFLVVLVSIFGIPSLGYSFWAKVCCYLQLLVAVIWSVLCLATPSQGQSSSWEWMGYSDLEGSEGRLVWLVTDLLCYGLLAGLVVYQLCISNVLHLAHWAHPSMAEALYQHGLRAGMLVAIWLTPATQGARSVMSVAFLVDWWGESVVGP